MTGKPRKRKHKGSRKRTTGRVGTILFRKEKRKKQLEENKYILGVLKPQHRSKE